MIIQDTTNMLLLSIIYQLLDHGADISELNPNVQEYLYGLAEEFNSADPEEQEAYEKVYHFADSYFNHLEGKNKLN